MNSELKCMKARTLNEYFKCPLPSLVKIYLMIMTNIALHRLKFIQEPIFLIIFPFLVILQNTLLKWGSKLFNPIFKGKFKIGYES